MENLKTYTISKKQYISPDDLMKLDLPKFKCKNGRRFVTKFKLANKDYIYAKSKSGQWIQSAGESYRHDKVFLTTTWVEQFLKEQYVEPVPLIELSPTTINIDGNTITNYTINGAKWFVINDILTFLKYKDHKSARKKISKKFKLQFKYICELHQDTKFIHADNIHPNTLFINEPGLIVLLERSKQPNIHKLCNTVGIKINHKTITKSSAVIATLNEFNEAAGIEYEQNYKVPKSRFVIDYYMPTHKLAIDINGDNNGELIEKKLGCQFIQCGLNDKNFSVIKLLGQIYRATHD